MRLIVKCESREEYKTAQEYFFNLPGSNGWGSGGKQVRYLEGWDRLPYLLYNTFNGTLLRGYPDTEVLEKDTDVRDKIFPQNTTKSAYKALRSINAY